MNTRRERFVHALCVIVAFCAVACGRTSPWKQVSDIEGVCPMALNVDFQGVWTAPNPHSKVPSGAARRAENLISPEAGKALCVPGQENLSSTYTTGSERLLAAANYDGGLVEHTSGNTLYYRDLSTGTLTSKGSLSPPAGVVRMPFAVAGEKLYMATSTGLDVLDGGSGTPVAVEMPEPLSIIASLGPDTLFSGAGQSVAYRYVISRLQSDGSYRRSRPSGRAVYVSAGTESVNVFVWLPDGLLASDRIEVYRTGIAAAGVDPGDTMYLVAQVNPASYILDDSTDLQTIPDITPDELRGEALYTNATQEGILRQNERPPYGDVLLAFDDFLMMANVRSAQRLTIRMIAIPDDLDTITIAGVTYTGKLLGYTGPEDYQIQDAYGVARNIEETARNLVQAINRRFNASPVLPRTVVAQYASGPNDPPGIIQIEAKSVVAAAFTAQASANGDRFEPPLDSAQSSAATVEENGIWLSKRGQHYAFPPLRSSTATYRFRVGNTGRPILKMVGLREALIVFVEGEGIWKVKRTGAESWRVDPINTKTHLLVPESVAVVDNQVLALTTRGLVAISEGSVDEIDLQIKNRTNAIKALSPTVLDQYAFAVGDEARLRYILYHPESNSSTSAGHAWVYNGDTEVWTERTDAASGGLVGEDDGLLYLGSASSNQLTRERTGEPSAMYQRPDGSAIPVRLEWTVFDEGDPAAMKQFTEMRLLTEDAITGTVLFTCTNDLGGVQATTGYASDNPTGEPYILAWVPDGCQRTSRLRVDIQRNVLGEAFTVVGMKTVVAGMYSGRLAR